MRRCVAFLGALAACGGDPREASPEDPVAAVEAAAPVFSQPLVSARGQFVNPDDVVAGEGRLLLRDDDELFVIGMAPPHDPHLVSELRRFGQQAVFAMTAHPTGITLLGLDGQLRVMAADAPQQLARTLRVYSAGHRPIALGAADSGWIAAHAVVTSTGGSRVLDSVIVTLVDSRGQVRPRAGFERVGPSRPDAFLRDRLAGRMHGATLVLTGSDPVRVIQLHPSGEQTDTLVDAPVRGLNDSERSGLRRLLAATSTPEFARSAPAPDARPAALAALPVEGGFLVVAQVGEASQGVDLYCGRSFRRTVLARPGLRRIFAADGIVAVDEPPPSAAEDPARLSFYSAADLSAECRQ